MLPSSVVPLHRYAKLCYTNVKVKYLIKQSYKICLNFHVLMQQSWNRKREKNLTSCVLFMDSRVAYIEKDEDFASKNQLIFNFSCIWCNYISQKSHFFIPMHGSVIIVKSFQFVGLILLKLHSRKKSELLFMSRKQHCILSMVRLPPQNNMHLSSLNSSPLLSIAWFFFFLMFTDSW